MKKASYLILSLAFLSCIGCDDDKTTDTTNQCKDHCNGQKLVVCASNGTEIVKDCGSPGCNSEKAICNTGSSAKCTETQCDGNNLNICDPDTGKVTVMNCGKAGCNPKDKRCYSSSQSDNCQKTECNGNNLNICDPDTGKVTVMNCGKAGCNTTTSRCNTISQDDMCKTSACEGNKLLICDTTTGYMTETDCGAAGCNAEALECNVAEEDKCKATQCDGTKLLVCNPNGTVTTKDCGSAGCNAEKLECNESAGYSCSATTCDGNKLMVCNPDGTVTTKDCGSAGCNAEKLECNEPAAPPFQMNEVPASQNNKEDAKCNPDTFVAHCSGNVAITCEESWDEENTYIVTHFDCEGGDFEDWGDDDWGDDDWGDDDWGDWEDIPLACAVFLRNGKNQAECIEATPAEADICKASDLGIQNTVCESGEDADATITYECKQFSDGTMRRHMENYTDCSTPCSQGCEQIKCDFEKDGPKCVDNNAMTCMGLDYNDNDIWSVTVCGSKKCKKDDTGIFGEYVYCE